MWRARRFCQDSSVHAGWYGYEDDPFVTTRSCEVFRTARLFADLCVDFFERGEAG